MSILRSCFKISTFTFFIVQSSSLFAAGFQINEISPRLQGQAMAGAAAENNDVSSMYVNPATLSSLQQSQIYVAGSGIFPHINMNSATAVHTVNVPGEPPSSISAPVIGDSAQDNVGKSAFVPNAYFGWRINDRWTAGLAMLAPFGLETNYDSDNVVRFIAKKSALQTIDLNPAVAFKLNDKFSFGLGFEAEKMNVTLSNFNGPYTGVPSVDALIAASSATYLKADGWGYGYTLGATYLPDLKTRIGLSYRSVISTHLTGSGQQITSPGGITPAPSPDFLFNADTAVNGTIRTPAMTTLSMTRDINNWTVKASAQLNFWSTLNHLSINMPDAFATNATIETQWSNAWFIGLGADYRTNSPWVVRGGIAYDQTPTKTSTRDPRIPDSDRYWLTFGASYVVNNHVSFDGAYEHIFSPNQTVNVTQSVGTNAISTVPLEVNQVHATYRSSVDIVALAFRYSF